MSSHLYIVHFSGKFHFILKVFYVKLFPCMTTTSPSRAEETFKEIQAIEAEAHKILETAEKERVKRLHEAKRSAESLLAATESSARSEAEKMLNEARRQAEAEKQKIEAAARAEVEQLRKNTTPKTKKARELCR